MGLGVEAVLVMEAVLGLVSGCQYDHVPLFDEAERAFLRCDLWKPDCPPNSTPSPPLRPGWSRERGVGTGECEVAGRDVRGRLGLRTDQADFLCCIDPELLSQIHYDNAPCVPFHPP